MFLTDPLIGVYGFATFFLPKIIYVLKLDLKAYE